MSPSPCEKPTSPYPKPILESAMSFSNCNIHSHHPVKTHLPQPSKNLLNEGLTSANRSNSATLPLTVPRFHSSRLLAISLHLTCSYVRLPRAFKHQTNSSPVYPYSGIRYSNRVASSLDSDLEAFSHYPADGSVAPLASQPRAKPIIRTNSSSRTTLDYYCNAPISRVKLTCLTTV